MDKCFRILELFRDACSQLSFTEILQATKSRFLSSQGVIKVIRPYLEALQARFSETTCLALRKGDGVLFASLVESSLSLHTVERVGSPAQRPEIVAALIAAAKEISEKVGLALHISINPTTRAGKADDLC